MARMTSEEAKARLAEMSPERHAAADARLAGTSQLPSRFGPDYHPTERALAEFERPISDHEPADPAASE